MSQQDRPPTEEEMRAAYEAQVKALRVDDVLIETVVSLVNLGGRKAGLAPGTEDERDPEQLRLAIDGASALLPLVESRLGPDAARVKEVLSQLQMAYAQLAGRRRAGGRAGPAAAAAALRGRGTGPCPVQRPALGARAVAGPSPGESGTFRPQSRVESRPVRRRGSATTPSVQRFPAKDPPGGEPLE